MQIKVQLNNLRIATRKSRLVVDLIRGKDVAIARASLEFTVKRAADPILKLLNSAIASAVNDFKLDESNLYVATATVDEGPTLKRSFPMSRGRAYPIMKRTSHVTIIISERKSTKDIAAGEYRYKNNQKPSAVKKEDKKAEVKEVKSQKSKVKSSSKKSKATKK